MARKHSRLNLSKGGRLETLWSENRPTSAPSDPKWTSDNLKLQPHELQQNPEIAEQSACVQKSEIKSVNIQVPDLTAAVGPDTT